MRVGRQRRFVNYLLCMIVVLEVATVGQTSGAAELLQGFYGDYGEGIPTTQRQPIRRHASFSVTHDLMTLTKMLNDESQRRRMHGAAAFFNSLRKRRPQTLKQPLYAVPARHVLLTDGINVDLDLRRLQDGT